MSTLTLSFRPAETDDAVAFVNERAQAMADEAAEAEYERRERIERFVTFDDLLEELVSTEAGKQRDFMIALASGDRASCTHIYLELHAAKERIIERRLAQGE
jgi:hypothetical protein